MAVIRISPHLQETKISLYVAAGTVLLLGYADLARGGTTISAFLLALAYCALIPLALWSGLHDDVDSEDRPSYAAAAIASIVVFALYVVTMAPSTAMWDTSEYIAAAYTFGLPHPPGNPFFVIIGRVFSLLPIAPNVAARVNLLAAICSSASAGFWFLVTEYVARRWLTVRWMRLVVASAAALIGATAFTVWNQSVVNEKVYTVSLLGMAIVSWLAVRWTSRPTGPRADRYLVMIAYLCGLGYANHMAGMLPGPAIALAVLLVRPATLLRPRLLLACLAALAVGVSPFATQPIRAAYFPAMNEGEPTACRTKLELSCTFSKGTLDAFNYNFNRGQYGKPELSDRQASLGEQIGMWWLYFKWQWFRDASSTHPFSQALAAAAFFVLGALGAWVHARRDRDSFWYFGALMFTTTLLLIYYLNFKLGWSQDQGSPAPHEVRDRDYFYLWSFSAWSVWAALGLAYVWEAVASLVGGVRDDRSAKSRVPTLQGWRYASPVLALALLPLGGNWTSASRHRHYATRDSAADLLNSVEPYGVLVTVGDNDTFPLWYAQEVEGIRRDVVVACTSLLNTDWYVRQIIRRPIYDYDAARGPEIYRNKVWTKPTTSPIHMTMSEADSVPSYYQLPQPLVFTTPYFQTTVDPKNLELGVLQRADFFVLRMIRDAWPERPIYFARSSAGYPRSLGLGNYTLVQGLASKVFVPPTNVAAMKDTVFVQGDAWFDIARTNALWKDVFKGQQAMINEGHWVDRASVSMPYLYVMTGAELADALRSDGRTQESAGVIATTKQVAHAIQLDELIPSLDREAAPPTGDSSGIPLRVNSGDQPKTQSTEPPVKKSKSSKPSKL